MISMMAMACVIFYAFGKLIVLAQCTEWDIQPVVILFLVMISAVRFRAELHRRLA
jgi:hypothetical protein